MLSSLRDIQIVYGFDDVDVEFFYQLPSTWGRGKVLAKARRDTWCLVPTIIKRHSKWVRFSKEVMLLSSSRKPTKTTGIADF